jgi:hypothetical protein
MTILHAWGMRAGVGETWNPYRDETFGMSVSLLCCIYTAEHSIALDLATVVRCCYLARPVDNPGRPREL